MARRTDRNYRKHDYFNLHNGLGMDDLTEEDISEDVDQDMLDEMLEQEAAEVQAIEKSVENQENKKKR